MSFRRPHSLVIPAPKGVLFQPEAILKGSVTDVTGQKNIESNILNVPFLLLSRWALEALPQLGGVLHTGPLYSSPVVPRVGLVLGYFSACQRLCPALCE